MSDDSQASEQTLDLTDVDRWVGMQSAGGAMKDPLATPDARRRLLDVQNPNPLYRDGDCAAEIRIPALD